MKKYFYLFILSFILFLIPINVNADSYSYKEYTAQFYDNINGSLNSISTSKNDSLFNGIWISDNIGMTANSSGAALGFESPIPLIKDHSYSVSLPLYTFGNQALVSNRFNLSTYNRIGYGTSLSSAVTSYTNNNGVNLLYSRSSSEMLQFTFKVNQNSSYLVIPFGVTISATYQFAIGSLVIDDLGTGSVSQEDINSSLNNQTTTINNYINDMSSNLNDSINEMGEDVKDSINDVLGNCHTSLNLFNKNSVNVGFELQSSNGSISSNSLWYVSDYISVSGNTNYTLSGNKTMGTSNVFYDSNKNFISVTSAITGTFKTPSNAKYVRFNGRLAELDNNIQFQVGTTATSYEPFGEICTSKLDDTNDKLDNLNDSINNNDTSSAESDANSFFDNFQSDDFGLSDVITMPLTLINSLNNATCVSLDLQVPFVDKTLSLPCMSSLYSKFFGSFFTLYQMIIFGFTSYWVCIRIYNLVKDFKNPDHDEIEVLDL